MKNMNERKFGIGDKLGYALGDFGNNATLQVMQIVLLIFATKVLGISGAIMGILFMVARFADAFTDVTMGRIVDTYSDKNGERFRPWIRRMAVPVVLFSILMYNYWIVNWPMWGKVMYIFVTYLIYGSVCYTGINIPYGAMANSITDDPAQRTVLSTFRSTGSALGGMMIGILVPLVIYVKDSSGNDIASGPRIFLLAVIMGVFALLSYAACYFGCKERVHVPVKTAEKAGNVWHQMGTMCKDKAILTILLISICTLAATGTFLSLNSFLFLDYFGNTGLQAIASLGSVFGMLIVAPFAPALSKKFGKKELSIAGFIIYILSYAGRLFLRQAAPFLVLNLLGYIGLGLHVMVNWAMISDCIDNYYVTTGSHADGTIYAIYSFVQKLSGAITSSIGAWSLAAIHYDNLAVVQIQPVRDAIYLLNICLPAGFILIALVLMILYPLNREKVRENASKLKELSANSVDLQSTK